MSENKTKEEILFETYVSVCMEAGDFDTAEEAEKEIRDTFSEEDTRHIASATFTAMQAYADQEKRSAAIAFVNAVTEDGCSNYFRKGDEWFLGDPEEEEDAEGPFTTAQLYDQFINSL